MSKRFNVELKCYELAEHFMPPDASERDQRDLTHLIQELAKDYRRFIEERDAFRKCWGEKAAKARMRGPPADTGGLVKKGI